MASRFRRKKTVCTRRLFAIAGQAPVLSLGLVSLFLLAASHAEAQNANGSATDFFNSGAQFYISNNIPDALKRTETGLKLYPDNVKLKELEKLLKQQQQQQQQNQNQQQKNQNSQQNQSKQNQSQNQQQKNQQQQKSGQQQQNQQNQANSQKQQEQSQKQQAMAMTPEEAKRLLDSQKGNEQVLQFSSKNQPQNENPPLKDW